MSARVEPVNRGVLVERVFAPRVTVMPIGPKPFMQLVIEADELTATKELLNHADELLGLMRFIDRDAHAVTAVLATGAEKVLKLTYGLLLAHETGAWPVDDIKGFRHRISDLDDTRRALLRSRESRATNNGVVESARTTVENDPWIDWMLRILQRYATNGRLYNLDYLGQQEQPEPSPRRLWQALDHETWEADPTGPTEEGLTADAIQQRRAAAWQRSLRRWRELYYQAWVQNMCGPDAKRYGFEIRGPRPD